MVKLTRERAFDVLGVEHDADEDTIKKSYRKLALKWHPDKNPDNQEEAKSRFQEVYAAHQKVTQPESESEDEFTMDDDDMEDAFSFFMHMMQMKMGMAGGGRRSGGGASPFGEAGPFAGGGSMGGFEFTFVGGGNPFMHMPMGGGGGPSMYGGSRHNTRFSRDDDDEDDYYYSQSREQQWQNELRQRREEARTQRRREKEMAAREEQFRRRAEHERLTREARQQRQQQQAEKAARLTPQQLTAQRQEEARKQEAELRKLLQKLPRPTMASRTESSVSLNLSRGNKEEQGGKGSAWEVQYHALHDPIWVSKEGRDSSGPVTCSGLQSGTKYVFKARAGLFLDAKKVVWGDWSVESQYVTLGQAAAMAPAAAAAAAPPAGFGKKRNKKGADKGTEKKMSSAAVQQAVADEQHAIQQLQAEKDKEAARKAALEQAAAEYAAETAKFQPKEAAGEATGESKKQKKKRNKKKGPQQQEDAESTSEQKQENRPQQTNSNPSAQAQTPRHLPGAPHPPGPTGTSRSGRDFGLGLPGEGPANQRRRPTPSYSSRPASSGNWAQAELGISASEMERLHIQEAIQMSQALEESRRMYEEQNRHAPPDERLEVDEDKFPALPGAPSPTPPPAPPSPPPAATQPSASSTNPKVAHGYGLWGPPPFQQQDGNPSAAQPGTLSQQQPSWDQATPVDSGWGQEHHQEDVWDQNVDPSQNQASTSWGQKHHQADGWGQNHPQEEQNPGPSPLQADPIESGWGQQHSLKDEWDQFIGPDQALPASKGQHWEQKTNGRQQQQHSRGSGWDQSDVYAQGIWEQPQAGRQQDPWQNAQQGTWDPPDQGTWGQPPKQANFNKAQQGTWGQPAQEPSSALNQDGWDAPVGDPALAPYNSRGGGGGWGEGPVPGPYDHPPEVPGLNWQGLVGKGPSSAGQGSKQTEWDPRPDYRADSYRSGASGLTTEQLAHHDMLTSSQNLKAERQKASIDRWNQDVVEPLDSSLQASGWSHDQKPPIAPHAYGHVDHHQLSQDPSGSFQADHHRGHQSSMSHHRQQGGQSSAKRYNPYDLSPAYLGSYTDEPENPSSPYDGYTAGDAGHVPHDHYESSGRHQPYSYQKQQGRHDRSSLHGGQQSSYSRPVSNYYQSQDQSYALQHDQPTAQDSGAFDFGTQQGWASHNRQHESPQGRGSKSHRGGRPAHPATSGGFGDLSHQQASPYNPDSGWEDDVHDAYGDPNQKLRGQEVPATQEFDASQFREHVQADIRPRGSKQKGRGRGRSQQQPYRPDRQPKQQAKQPAGRHQQAFSEAEALQFMHQEPAQHQHDSFAQQHQSDVTQSQTQYAHPRGRRSNTAQSHGQQGSVAPPPFFSDLFPQEVA